MNDLEPKWSTGVGVCAWEAAASAEAWCLAAAESNLRHIPLDEVIVYANRREQGHKGLHRTVSMREKCPRRMPIMRPMM